MASERIVLTLSQKTRDSYHGPPGRETLSVWPSPSSDPERDRQIGHDLAAAAAATGVEAETEREPDAKVERFDRGTAYYGGPPVVHAFTDLVTYAAPYAAYAGVAAGGMAAFLRNALGSIVEWRNLRQGRSVSIDVRGTLVEISDGATIEEVLPQIEEALSASSDDGGRRNR